MSVAGTLTIFVTDHAMWQAAERFPGFDTARIEDEVRSALAGGRINWSRRHVQPGARDDPRTLYVWTEFPGGHRRVYALVVDRYDDSRFVVTTTMRGRSTP